MIGTSIQHDIPDDMCCCGWWGNTVIHIANDIFSAPDSLQGQPWCFFKTSAPVSYQVDSVTNTNLGLKVCHVV